MMTLEKLLSEIHMSPTYTPEILSAYEKWIKQGEHTPQEARELLGRPETFRDPEKAVMLLLYIAVEERNHGAWARYPEDVFINSMLVFTRSVDFAKKAVGKETWTKGPWPLIHVSARWFRLGELEFELNEEHGTKEIHIHIPAGAKLTPDALRETFALEKRFMHEYLPEWAGLTHACESWMMSPKLKELLPENSRILWFQSLFDIERYTPTLRWVLEFVFNLEEFQQRDVDLHTLFEKTSLQRRMKQYILSGGNPGEGRGILVRSRIEGE